MGNAANYVLLYRQIVSVSHRLPEVLSEGNPASPIIPITYMGHLTPPIRKFMPNPHTSSAGNT